MNIKACLDSVAPYDTIHQKLIQDMLDVFVQFINDKSKLTIDIENSYIGENAVIDDELVKIYLNDIYTILTSLENNQAVSNALDAFSANYPKSKYIALLTEMTNLLISTESEYNINFFSQANLESDGDSTGTGGALSSMGSEKLKEYLYTAKAFKQRKGTLSALKYGYNVVRQSGIQDVGTTDAVTDTLFDVQYGTDTNPNEPFYFRITGSLLPALYDNAVVPIAHPLGFGYEYLRLMKLAFSELDLVKEQQSNYDVKIVCDNGNYSYPINAIDIINITKVYDDFGDVRITVYLTEDAEIASSFSSTGYKIVRDYNSLVYLYDEFDNILIDYPDFCALYTLYDVKYISGIVETETIDIVETYPIEYVRVPTEPSFEIDVWCVGETYYITSEDDEVLITEQGDYTLITCLL